MKITSTFETLQAVNFLEVDTLTISKCHNIVDLYDCPQVRNLKIINCDNFRNLEGCPNTVEFIYVKNCQNFKNLEGCSNTVFTLMIKKCRNFESLLGFRDSIDELSLFFCPALKNLDYIGRYVSSLTCLCSGVKNLDIPSTMLIEVNVSNCHQHMAWDIGLRSSIADRIKISRCNCFVETML